MAFRSNEIQQMSLYDCFWGLTEREQKVLNTSWAKIFGDEVFPAIDESKFSVLYSEEASRPNTPVNIIIGALLIKELFDLSDDEVVENLMLDTRYQYALHTTSFEEQPLSDKSLSRFRKRCYDYERLKNVDLLHDCVKDLSSKIVKMMKLNGRIRRMDSMMIEANIRRLSRIELLYTCIAGFVTYLHKHQEDELIEGMEHYYDPDDFNRVLYHNREQEATERLAMFLTDADKLLEKSGDKFEDVTEYQLLVRCLSEQTIVKDKVRRLKTKEDGDMDSKMLQNPSDPEATFRSKAGKEHRGYAANLEETVGENGSVVTDYAYDQNIHSDSAFLKEHLEQMDKQEETVTLVADGAYSGKTNHDLAESKNVNLVNTDLSGKETADIYADFQFSEDGHQVVKCPAGYSPKACCYSKKTEQCRVSFDRNQCASCPHKDQCRAKIYKKVAVIFTSVKAADRAKQKRAMNTEKFRNLARIRNGIETVPSILRNKYHVDKMPVRGKLPGKFFFGCKIAALNFRKLFNYRKGLGYYAQNPELA